MFNRMTDYDRWLTTEPQFEDEDTNMTNEQYTDMKAAEAMLDRNPVEILNNAARYLLRSNEIQGDAFDAAWEILCFRARDIQREQEAEEVDEY